jgi:hypothetical protein
VFLKDKAVDLRRAFEGEETMTTETSGHRLLPEPYPHRLLPFIWKRLTGWRDKQGRPAAFIGWRELFSRDF